MADRDNHADFAHNTSLGSQGNGFPSYMTMEEEDRTTRVLAMIDLEWDRAQFDRQWETGFGEDSSSSGDSISSASTMEAEDESDIILRQASMPS